MPDLYTTAELRDALLGASATLLVGTPFNAAVLNLYLTTDSNLEKSLNSEDPVQLVVGLTTANVTAIANGATAYGWGNHASAGYELQSNKGQPSGYVPLTAESKIDLSYLPNTVIERLIKVADEAARFALTTATVQNGDSVKQMDTEMFYYVSDDTKLDNEDGYDEYNAGIAGAVEYSNVLNKPANLTSLASLTFASNSFVKMTGANTFALDTNTYLTSESDTLATVTGRGASSATAISLTGGLTLGGGFALANGLIFGDGDTGFYENDDDSIAVKINNNLLWRFFPTFFGNYYSTGGAIQVAIPTSTIPTFTPRRSDYNTGIGWNAEDSLALIAGGVNGLNVVTTAGVAKVGIGTTTPTAALHIKAGTATAGTAPLKLTSGTNLTTPENGAFEFDGTNLYFTVGGVRKTVTLT